MPIIFKACPKCGGDVERPRTNNKVEDPTCLQCGFEVNRNSMTRIIKKNNAAVLKLTVDNV